MVMGRPQKYKKEYCDEVVNYMSKGFSLTAFAAHIGTSVRVLYQWQKKHKDFFHACNKAQDASQQWWEKLAMLVGTGQNHDKGYKKANAGMIQFMMSRRFKDYYKRTHTNITNSDKPEDKEAISQIQIEPMDRIKATKILNEYMTGVSMTDEDFRKAERAKLDAESTD